MPHKFQQYTKKWIARESEKKKQARAFFLLRLLKKQYPKSAVALHYNTPMQLLVAVMLSAQCTDKKVNEVTATLFRKYKTPDDFAAARQKIFEQEIKSTGFYRTKAKNIIAAARIIQTQFHGALPRVMPEMLTLPGVARKTANIVLGQAYGIIEGIPVDTHVARIAQRLGLTKNTHPEKIEHDLMKLLPKSAWGRFSYLIIDHGRALCKAQRRNCADCPLNKHCPSSLI